MSRPRPSGEVGGLAGTVSRPRPRGGGGWGPDRGGVCPGAGPEGGVYPSMH